AMIDSQTGIWYPSPEQIANSNVAQLMQRVGVSDYESFYRYSVAHPDQYWKAVLEYCAVVWSKNYDSFAYFSAGGEFPRWFLGCSLNWTETIFKWAKDAETCGWPAVVAETEDGTVTRLSYAELWQKVRAFAKGLERLGLRRGDRVGLLMEAGIEA